MTKQSRSSASLPGMILAALCLASTAYAPATLAAAAAAKTPNVAVDSFAQHTGDRITYSYYVSNRTPSNIISFAVGRDSRKDADPDNDIYELQEYPSGWNLKFGVPAASYNAPTGWRLNLLPPEADTLPYAIAWEPLNDRSPKFAAGQSSGKFSVTLDKADPNYLTGSALILLDGETPTGMSVPIRSLDHTPPTLTVTLSPNILPPENGKPVAINANFTVQDDYDKMPQIKLESITAAESGMTDEILDASPGLDDRYFKIRIDDGKSDNRIYTVTYSATDASGNQAMASATVTVGKPN
ncbi:MAG TPA: hypothetical protein VGD24_06195 [Gallionella sp.]